jgi:TolB protein
MRRRFCLLLIGLMLLTPFSVHAQTATPTPPSGGGAGLLLYATATESGTEIFSVRVDGIERTPLTKSRNPKLYPMWSPDGEKILYEEIVGNLNAIYVKEAKLDATPKDVIHGSYPRWTPDGKQIILTIDGGGTSIYQKNADGTGAPQIVLRARTAKDARLYPSLGGPDGKTLVYASRTGSAGTYEIYVTGISDRLGSISKNNTDDRYPVWSPDGDKIAYANSDGQICLIEISKITKTITTSKCFPNYVAENSCPSWSPDSTQIAFVSKIYNDYKYYVMNLDGSNVHPLVDDPAYVWKQPNGFIRCSPVSWR